MIFALLISAIIWNAGTWYLGLPASSSHTMIGAIMGVGLAHSVMAGHGWMGGINWGKAQEVGAALLLSPAVGFIGAAALLLILKFLVRREDLYQAPVSDSTPPFWIRGVLMITCTLVSFFHGSNDGQKGMGLMMLILVGLVPAAFALNLANDPARLTATAAQMQQLADTVTPMAKGAAVSHDHAIAELTRFAKEGGNPTDTTYAAIARASQTLAGKLGGIANMAMIPRDQRVDLRSEIYLVADSLNKLVVGRRIVDPGAVAALEKEKQGLDEIVKYIPVWVKVAVAIALGIGTTIGWKRIVVTVGEKIGKSHLTYAQGACAELMAAGTIGLADFLGLPVSTTHVLSSGIAGSMAANRSGLQKNTLVSILLAWVLTLPVCMFLGATIFSAALYMTVHAFGIE
jgi:PiT family inorganic phosphate transporter